jgi:hypothetical protein
MATNYSNRQMSVGNFQKAWIRMRHFIAIAELMGLPKAYQAVEFNKNNNAAYDETQVQRAQLWESICSADRLFGMIINLPSATGRYQLSRPSDVTIGGVVQTRAYICRLTDITTKVQDLDDMNSKQRSGNDIFVAASNIDRELKELASQTPRSWWAAADEDPVKADHVLRFQHSCITMRVHLPLAMRQDPNGEYTSSRIACVDACESVANRYQFLRRRFPSGMFLSRIMDVQAFTAVIVLLLTSQNSTLMDHPNLRTTKSKIESLVMQVTDLMDSDATNFGQHGVNTIRSLQILLQQDTSTDPLQQLSINVPLLGNVRVRRNIHTAQSPNTRALNPDQNIQETNSWGPDQQTGLRPSGQVTGSTNTLPDLVPQSQEDWRWDPLSWSVDDYNENYLFQDSFVGPYYDQFDVWQSV